MPQGIRYKPAEQAQQVKQDTEGNGSLMRTIAELLGFADLTQIPAPSAMTSRLPALISKIPSTATVRDFPKPEMKAEVAARVKKTIGEWLDNSMQSGKLTPEERQAIGKYFGEFGDEVGYLTQGGPIGYVHDLPAHGAFHTPPIFGTMQSKVGPQIQVNPTSKGQANILAHEGEHFKQFLRDPLTFSKDGVYHQLRSQNYYYDIPEEIAAREGAKAAGFPERISDTMMTKIGENLERTRSGHYLDQLLNWGVRPNAAGLTDVRAGLKRREK
jgi:hypothetical protein